MYNEIVKKIKINENNYDLYCEKECNICLKDLVDEDYIRQMVCNHLFHDSCIKHWMDKKQTCPTCREPHGFSELILKSTKFGVRKKLKE